jgi:CheY-like chemotaxis protein
MDASHRILVVDDDVDLRETLVEALELRGYEVASAGNGREALDLLLADQAPPCLILLDVMMPVMDGFEFRRCMRADPRLAGIPVVVITAGGRGGLEALEAPVLAKPVTLSGLISTVREHC